jgi:hypothetical protein
MSLDEEIGKIPQQKLASDMPETFTATVIKITKDVKKGQYAGAPIIKLELQLENGETVLTSYRVPKAWTGKGQMDKLLQHMKGLGIGLDDMQGKTFQWKREELGGTMKGNERHYPTKIIKVKKAET